MTARLIVAKQDAKLLFRHTAVFARLRDVLYRTNLKRPRSAIRGSAACSPSVRRGGRLGRPGDLHLMSDVLAELCRIAGELVTVSMLISEREVAMATIQTTLDGRFASRRGLARGIGTILRHDPTRADKEK